MSEQGVATEFANYIFARFSAVTPLDLAIYYCILACINAIVMFFFLAPISRWIGEKRLITISTIGNVIHVTLYAFLPKWYLYFIVPPFFVVLMAILVPLANTRLSRLIDTVNRRALRRNTLKRARSALRESSECLSESGLLKNGDTESRAEGLEDQGEMLGAFSGINSLCSGISPLIFGLLFQLCSGPNPPVPFLGLPLMAGCASVCVAVVISFFLSDSIFDEDEPNNNDAQQQPQDQQSESEKGAPAP
jgi:MFS family permease